MRPSFRQYNHQYNNSSSTKTIQKQPNPNQQKYAYLNQSLYNTSMYNQSIYNSSNNRSNVQSIYYQSIKSQENQPDQFNGRSQCIKDNCYVNQQLLVREFNHKTKRNPYHKDKINNNINNKPNINLKQQISNNRYNLSYKQPDISNKQHIITDKQHNLSNKKNNLNNKQHNLSNKHNKSSTICNKQDNISKACEIDQKLTLICKKLQKSQQKPLSNKTIPLKHIPISHSNLSFNQQQRQNYIQYKIQANKIYIEEDVYISLDRQALQQKIYIRQLQEKLESIKNQHIIKENAFLKRENQYLTHIQTLQLEIQIHLQSIRANQTNNITQSNTVIQQAKQPQLKLNQHINQHLNQTLLYVSQLLSINCQWISLMQRTKPELLPGTAYKVQQDMKIKKPLLIQIQQKISTIQKSLNPSQVFLLDSYYDGQSKKHQMNLKSTKRERRSSSYKKERGIDGTNRKRQKSVNLTPKTGKSQYKDEVFYDQSEGSRIQDFKYKPDKSYIKKSDVKDSQTLMMKKLFIQKVQLDQQQFNTGTTKELQPDSHAILAPLSIQNHYMLESSQLYRILKLQALTIEEFFANQNNQYNSQLQQSLLLA